MPRHHRTSPSRAPQPSTLPTRVNDGRHTHTAGAVACGCGTAGGPIVAFDCALRLRAALAPSQSPAHWFRPSHLLDVRPGSVVAGRLQRSIAQAGYTVTRPSKPTSRFTNIETVTSPMSGPRAQGVATASRWIRGSGGWRWGRPGGRGKEPLLHYARADDVRDALVAVGGPVADGATSRSPFRRTHADL